MDVHVMSNLKRRITTLEKAAGLDRGPHGTIEFHANAGSSSPDYEPCDLRAEHGPACAFHVVSRNQSGTRFMRLYGFDPAELD
jgi:hypothetical protein